MADIFISYARTDRAVVQQLADALVARGYSVWWDRELNAGAKFSAEIERELAAADRVVVCWSENALQSRWVRDEADEAATAEKLACVSLDGSKAPIGYRQYHALDLSRWSGNADAGEIEQLLRSFEPTIEIAPQPIRPKPKAPAARRRGAPVALIGLGVLIGAAVLGFTKLTDQSPDATRPVVENPAAPAPPGESRSTASIAVLALADLSPQGNQRYFADGISEEILNVLARVDGLTVASRTSAFAMRNRDDLGIPEIATALGVRYVMEGSLRKAGDTVRITVQLVDATRDAQLFSETFDRQLTAETLFELQEDIAATTVAALADLGALPGIDRERIQVAAETRSLKAYEDYLKGHQIFIARDALRFDEMLAQFEASIVEDPGFARAQAALAAGYNIMPGWGFADRPYGELAQQAARRAIELDPELGIPYAVLAEYVCGEAFYGCTERFDLTDRSIQAEPNNPALHNWRGQAMLETGFAAEARSDFERCLELDPARILCRAFLAVALIKTGELAQGVDLAHALTDNDAAALHVLGIAGMVYGAGLKAEARKLVSALEWEVLPGQYLVENLFGEEQLSKDRLRELYDEEVARFQAIDPRSGMPPQSAYFYRQFDLLDGFDGFVVWQTFYHDFLQSPVRYAMMDDAGLINLWRARGFPPPCQDLPDAAPGERSYRCD
ncbi:MAG: TIR domain-containing protein [Pseudomonadota bacterium]